MPRRRPTSIPVPRRPDRRRPRGNATDAQHPAHADVEGELHALRETAVAEATELNRSAL